METKSHCCDVCLKDFVDGEGTVCIEHDMPYKVDFSGEKWKQLYKKVYERYCSYECHLQALGGESWAR